MEITLATFFRVRFGAILRDLGFTTDGAWFCGNLTRARALGHSRP